MFCNLGFTINKEHSSKSNKIKIKYLNAYRYGQDIVLKTIYETFGLENLIALPLSETNPDRADPIRRFFSGCNEIFYSNIYKLDKLIDDNDVIIDGGGNIGLFSLYAKNLKKNLSCLLFEPEMSNFEVAKKNLANHEGIEYFNEGLFSEVSQGELLLSSNVMDHKLDSKLIDFEIPAYYYDRQKIKLNTIDNAVLLTNKSKVDLIKLDIEGSELLALQGAVETIKKYTPLLLIAVDHSKKQKRNIIDFFKENFNIYSSIEINKENILFYDPEKHLHRIQRLQDVTF